MASRILVSVKPNSGSSKLEFDPAANMYRASVKAPPEKGKANSELIKLIRKRLGKNPVIVSGAKSKRKIIELI